MDTLYTVSNSNMIIFHRGKSNITQHVAFSKHVLFYEARSCSKIWLCLPVPLMKQLGPNFYSLNSYWNTVFFPFYCCSWHVQIINGCASHLRSRNMPVEVLNLCILVKEIASESKKDLYKDIFFPPFLTLGQERSY